MGSVPLTERQTSPSELGPENLDLSSFNGSYRMWRRFVCLCIVCQVHGLLSAATHAPFPASMLRPTLQSGPMNESTGVGEVS